MRQAVGRADRGCRRDLARLQAQFRSMMGSQGTVPSRRLRRPATPHLSHSAFCFALPPVVVGQVTATLNLLEHAGGPEAFHHIKYHVPAYESCLRP